ncbi:PREDICTED: uncharacterized protein LOC104753536 [Camelina sativa]|uniref:Uncharacterized protein LOC104753536 n=1 Tax=Camelina sativa TaxID=90675 RepID=A0ABM0WPA9_CAMSA|nr:PREDICTED: uncharacterized protein LOC104753536 [Camelina sativa]
MIQQMLLGQANGQLETAKKLAEFNQRLDSSYNDLNIKFESLNSKLKFMESNIASTSALKPNQLPGKAVQNPTEFTVRFKLGRICQKTKLRVKVLHSKQKTEYIPPAYKPPLPFPGRLKLQKLKELREIIEKKELTALKEEVPIQYKEEERGPALEQYFHFNKCLCDLGASISVMPYSIAQKFGHTDFKPNNLYLCLADESHKDVVGKMENFPVKIGKARIPTDFLIIDMDNELEDPIILGRPFIATDGAIIDVKEGGQPFVLKDKRDHEVSSEVGTPKAKFSSDEDLVEKLKGSVQELTSLVKELQVQINKRSLKKERPRFKLKQKQGSSLKGEVIKNQLHSDQVTPGRISSPHWSPNQA